MKRLATIFGAFVLMVAVPVFISAQVCRNGFIDRKILIWSKDSQSNVPLFRVVKGKKVGYIDSKGRLKIPFRFDYNDENYGWDFTDGLAAVQVGEEWGYINSEGRMVIPPQFAWASGFSEGRASVSTWKQENQDVYIDKTGKQVGPTLRDAWSRYSEGLVIFESEGKQGYRDLAGNVAIEPRFKRIVPFSEGLARVIERGDCRVFEDESDCEELTIVPRRLTPPFLSPCHVDFIDKSGRSVLSGYKNGDSFSEGLAAVRANASWGFIDHQGNWIIPERFERAYGFSEGLASVRVEGKWGFVDKSGALVIPPQFRDQARFSEGIALVSTKSNEYFYIDKAGRHLFGRSFSDATPFVQGLAHVAVKDRFDDEWAYIDHAGKIVYKYKAEE